MGKLNEGELKLTKLGWLPQKVVAETYPIGRPVELIEEFQPKRLNEYEVLPVWMARAILEVLGWTKIRKGMLSLTARGKKALADEAYAANVILRCALTRISLNAFDGFEDNEVGNIGRPWGIRLLNEFGADWRSGAFYGERYREVVPNPDLYDFFATRLYGRLLYHLGASDKRRNRQTPPLYFEEYRKTDLFPVLFSFK